MNLLHAADVQCKSHSFVQASSNYTQWVRTTAGRLVLKLCSHTTSARVFAFDAKNESHDYKCLHLAFVFAHVSNVKNSCKTHSLHLDHCLHNVKL